MAKKAKKEVAKKDVVKKVVKKDAPKASESYEYSSATN